MLNFMLLEDPLITATGPTGEKTRRSLPGTLVALVRGEIADFPRLRPHQRHVWHALLVQLALLASGRMDAGEDLPADEAAWRQGLLDLTPDDDDGAAWALVAPADRPAFMQAPVPGGDLSSFKPLESPDALDVLILSKNHDIKSGALPGDDPELWLYALVSLQTQEGFLGAGNYGIARMNGGFASRPSLSVLREGNVAASLRFADDVRRCRAGRAEIFRTHPYPQRGGVGLVWLRPWDGQDQIPLSACDPFFIEICRRVRLIATQAGLTALTASSKAARIEAKAVNGDTGDPWTPVILTKEGSKAFTADARGWSYAQLVKLLFPQAHGKGEGVTPAPLQNVEGLDPTAEMTILARVLVRGQGKTEGYFERHVPISALVRAGWGRTKSADPLAAIAHQRVEDAGSFAKHVLYPAVMAVCAGAPRTQAGERARDDTTTKDRAGRLCAGFDRAVDQDFFADLADEAEVLGDPAQAERVRAAWIKDRLFPIGDQVLTAALAAAPDAAARHWRVQVQARALFEGCFYKKFGERLKAAQMPPPPLSTDAMVDSVKDFNDV